MTDDTPSSSPPPPSHTNGEENRNELGESISNLNNFDVDLSSSQKLSLKHNPQLEEGLEQTVEKFDHVEINAEESKICGLRKVIHNPRYEFNPNEGSRRTLGQFFFAGRITRWFLWPVALIISFSYLVIIFGLFPLGKPLPGKEDRTTLGNTWVLLALVNPINSMVIGYLHYVVYLCCMGVERPFRVHPVVLAILFCIQILIWGPSIPFTGFFNLYGLAAIMLTLVTTYISIIVYERISIKHRKVDDSTKETHFKQLRSYYLTYLKVGIAVSVFLCILILYIFAFQYLGSSSVAQKLLPFAMSIIVFIVRKTMLGLMDSFPHEIAMFVSGFWVENMYDMFQAIAYPSVKDPTTYVTIWFPNFASIVANLVFLTSPWFNFRIWIKAFLSSLFHCKPVCCPGVEPDFEDREDERGHSNNLPGYHRRQIRFYFLKTLSKMTGCIFYLSTSAILRYGPNSAIYPYAALTERQYQFSVAFSAGNFAFFLFAGIVGYAYVRWRHRDLFEQMKKISKALVKDRAYTGLVVTVLVHNGILALYMLMYFNRIWYAFNLHQLRDDDDD